MLTIQGIHRAFDSKLVLRGIDLEVAKGEIVCLLGPSGCGKTTLLRIIAGLEQADRGNVLLEGQSILSLPVHQRGFGLMFQDFALFPHLDVAANVAFGLKMQVLPFNEQQTRVREVLELVNLTGFEKRDVAQLSGGERQRVALARSLAPNPRLLMLDEPLGSLDTALREQLIVDLQTIIKRLGLTAVYVTHDQHEAFAIADRIAVMTAGRIEQVAPPKTIYRFPSTAFVARFLGLNNILPVLEWHDGYAQTAVGTFALPTAAPFLLLHPGGFTLNPNGELSGQVTESVYMGDAFQIRFRHPSGEVLTFKLPVTTPNVFTVGETISVNITPEWIIPLGE